MDATPRRPPPSAAATGGRAGHSAQRRANQGDRPKNAVARAGQHRSHLDGAVAMEGVHASMTARMAGAVRQSGSSFLNDEALGYPQGRPLQDRGSTARFRREFVEEMGGKAPPSFTLTPRNPDRRITNWWRAKSSPQRPHSPPNAWDLVRGKRPAIWRPTREFIKLTACISTASISPGGYSGGGRIDIHPGVRHSTASTRKLVLTATRWSTLFARAPTGRGT